jgi:hypothetical protein
VFENETEAVESFENSSAKTADTTD